jgi:agmatinase
MALVLLDAHADTLQQEDEGQPFSHGTWLRRAVEQGMVVPERSVLAGMRGPVLDAAELEWPRQVGFDVISSDKLRRLGPAKFAKRVSKRVGDAPTHLSVDIDVVDPAFAPGTGTPEVGGLATSSRSRRPMTTAARPRPCSPPTSSTTSWPSSL